MDPLVRANNTAAVARADTTTVQNVLHRQVDVDALRLACDLDAVTQSRDRSVRPARSAVLLIYMLCNMCVCMKEKSEQRRDGNNI